MTLRGWMNIIKTLAITLAPLYIPVLLIVLFGFDIQSILASILFVQIYVLVIQAEAMLRQAAWSEAAYNAVFKVSADVRGQGTMITVANSGEKPAYNFFVGLRDETGGNPLEYKRLTDYHELDEAEAHALSMGHQQRFLISIPEGEFRKRRISLRISFDNVLGHPREIQSVSFEGSEEFFMMPTPVEFGFLVKAYGDLMLFTRWHFRYKKLLRK